MEGWDAVDAIGDRADRGQLRQAIPDATKSYVRPPQTADALKTDGGDKTTFDGPLPPFSPTVSAEPYPSRITNILGPKI
jgi:hypothetical protein